jgi:hypothetical protein
MLLNSFTFFPIDHPLALSFASDMECRDRGDCSHRPCRHVAWSGCGRPRMTARSCRSRTQDLVLRSADEHAAMPSHNRALLSSGAAFLDQSSLSVSMSLLSTGSSVLPSARLPYHGRLRSSRSRFSRISRVRLSNSMFCCAWILSRTRSSVS